jgi:hypothetical protein
MSGRIAVFLLLAVIRCHFMPSQIPEGRERRDHRRWLLPVPQAKTAVGCRGQGKERKGGGDIDRAVIT